MLWFAVHVLLWLELALCLLCCIPGARWRRAIRWFIDLPFVHVTTKGLPYLVVILMALLVQSIYIQVNARQHGEEARVMAGQSTTITLYEANMYRAQRNTYMAAIALLGMLMLREIIQCVTPPRPHPPTHIHFWAQLKSKVLTCMSVPLLHRTASFVRRCVEYEDEIARLKSEMEWSDGAVQDEKHFSEARKQAAAEKLHSAKEDIKASAKHAAREVKQAVDQLQSDKKQD
ncbi:uncharacterized protein MONBRDRAFT_36857 [Monosiga brevicollis MX1]|uniref:Endoplasmic reticulum transmembrane protein n=1 Tax=Monosiga brevicollis TaxID=81824 RepID=A9UY83_MONBE|nr:uncharacterized protein MONBRDRAFT_36857 [Monosiga brevicollis MX1]EDQ89812.1 predicted protein [Monosiga brevicollis MX1]|eukprot:XP_001745234.1 hypothetical protein [Monosiga brevicollis MX1]